MRWKILTAALCGIVLSGSVYAQNAKPVIRDFDVATIEKLGRAMYAQDIAVAKSSDSAIAHLSDAEKANFRGWVTEDTPSGFLVYFVETGSTGLFVAYDVAYSNGQASLPSALQNRPLSPAEQAQYDARQLVLQNLPFTCSRNYNTVALHEDGSDHWLVWALAATSDPNVVVAGGHFRFTVSADGKTILNRDALSAGCLNLGKPPAAPKGYSVAGLGLSTLVSPKPVETHVYMNLLYNVPLFVVADTGMWQISNGSLSGPKPVPKQ